MTAIEEQVFATSDADNEAFPLGIIKLDRSARIVTYNKAEAALSRQRAATTIGLNFFRDVAPCTAVKDFEGRFDDFILTQGRQMETFAFLFRFGWGQKEVRITMLRKPDDEDHVYLIVNESTFATPIEA
jgi:photoactive yellow protein